MYHSLRNKDLSIWLPFATHMSAIPGHRDMSTLAANYWNMFQLVKKYGNVISLDFGIKSSVIVSSLPLIKEAFTHLEENFMSRPQFPLQNLVHNENGKTFMCCQICVVIFKIHKRLLYALCIHHSHKPIPSWNAIINGRRNHIAWLKALRRWFIVCPSIDRVNNLLVKTNSIYFDTK